ncbi:hypothetical protein FV232_06955 [Methylobacterium sp. WL30]|uniref:hypothetical protein n=1 Tax=Methylobacterium sp. WL119 TaxID=2603888 RepID=UPI0011CCDD10|nr:hypothetical protein [Methylobacterium sp. WL119]TXN40440.1 hypothetical protein FV225_06150 [Methylobacterium sp. WL93]TXN49149.1 hypothetical protein FV227_17875 [Methylobacterium sp. WL119]TXN68970.1 hypothetical protein FV232_06955 [Methylobacterium sp. WL30]
MPTTEPSPALAHILADLTAAGVRPTSLGVICTAGDIGMSDQEISRLVDELAQRPLEEVNCHA